MAVVSNPLIGKSKQSAGGVTFTSWKGRNVLKNKATSVANPRSPLQVANRTRLSGSTKFYAKHRSALMLSFLRMMGDVTDGNKFVSLNRLCFSGSVVGLDVPSVSSLILSQGSLGTVVSCVVTQENLSQASFDIVYAGNPMQSDPSDFIALVAYNLTKDAFSVTPAAAIEGSQVVLAGLSSSIGDVLHFWAYSYSETGKKLGNSFYCGTYVAS